MIHTHGGDIYEFANIIDFSSNCNPLGVPKGVQQAIVDCRECVNNYPDVHCTELRSALAAHENYREDQIIFGNGAADVIFTLVRALLPKKALIPSPTFAEYEQALDSVGCSTEHYYFKEENGFAYDDGFGRALSKDMDILFLCNPNNPTGSVIPREYLLSLLKKAKEAGITVVIDECFLDFVENEKDYSVIPFLEEYKNLFVLKAFTKLYAMAGVRLGYGLTADKTLIQRMNESTQPWNVSTIAQKAGVAALSEHEYVEESLKLIAEERDYLVAKLRGLSLKVFSPKANYIFFKGPIGLKAKCIKKGILIRDCSNYEGLGNGYYRVAVKQHGDNQKLIGTLEEILLWQK